MRPFSLVLSAALSLSAVAPAVPAFAATGYLVTVTCTVPRAQPERQLAPDSCLNYLPDGTQTYTARVQYAGGKPVVGAWVSWTDDAADAHFRLAQNPCQTGSDGVCSAELKDRSPTSGERIKVRAAFGTAVDYGYLTFR